MATKSWAIAILVLRILTLGFLLASLIVLATNVFNNPDSDVDLDDEDYSDSDPDSKKLTFRDFLAYRYLLSVDVIGVAYMLVRTLVSTISVCAQTYADSKPNIWFHQFFDVVFALFFATGVGAGFGLTLDTAKELAAFIVFEPRLGKFFDLVDVSSGLLLVATVGTAAIIMCSLHVLAARK